MGYCFCTKIEYIYILSTAFIKKVNFTYNPNDEKV